MKKKKAKSSLPQKKSQEKIIFQFQPFLIPISILISSLIISIVIISGMNRLKWELVTFNCQSTDPYSLDCLKSGAKTIGLNLDDFITCMNQGKFNDVIESDISYSNSINITGTPALFLGVDQNNGIMRGFYIGGYMTYDAFIKIFEKFDGRPIEEIYNEFVENKKVEYDSYKQAIADYYASKEGGGLTGNDLNNKVEEELKLMKDQIHDQYRFIEITYKGGYVIGNGDIVLVEFSDFQCPYCKKLAQEVMPKIKTNLIDNGKLKFVYKDNPIPSLHPTTKQTSLAVRCAESQGKVWEMYDFVFEVK